MVKSPRLHQDPHCYDAHIFDSGQAVRPKNPYFLWRIYRIRPSQLVIPNGMIKEYKHLQNQKSLLIIDERGRKWGTDILKQDCGLMCSGNEWRRMFTANCISDGDICIFEFVRGCSGLDILVHVIRASRDECRNRELKYPQWTDDEIFGAGLAARPPNNPYFLWRAGNLKHNHLYIPSRLKNLFNHPRTQTSLFLIDEQGNRWKTNIMKGCSSSLECSSVGWLHLCAVNIVGAGDICICEIVQGCSGCDILVHVIRAHTLTRKKGFQEKEVERADKETMHENGSDESGTHRNISKAKGKFKSGSSSAPIRQSARIRNAGSVVGKKSSEEDSIQGIYKLDYETSCSTLPSNNNYEESDGIESSCVPVRRSARKDVGRKKSSEEASIERIHELDNELSCSSLPSNNDSDESEGDDISWAPVRRSARKDVVGKKSSEEGSIERIYELDDETSCSSLPSNNDNEESDGIETSCEPVRRSARKDDPHCYDAHIFDSGRAVRPKNPYFLWKIYRRTPRPMMIPDGMTKEYKHLQNQKSLLIIDERGRKWDTEIVKQDHNLVCSALGWRKMCAANKIGIGDVCICEFVQRCSGLDMVVNVIRALRDERRNRQLKYPLKSYVELIFEAGLAVRPKNPFFLWTVGHRKYDRVFIPKSMEDAFNHPRIQNSVSLIDEQGNKWKTKIMTGSNKLACSSEGWLNFCSVNIVDTGDICICEIVQGCSGRDILVHVIRAHTLTRKKGFQEEEVERADKETMHENDSDESGAHRNISKAKYKFKSVSASAPIRRSGRKRNASSTEKGFEEDKRMKIDDEMSCSSPPCNNDSDESDGDESSCEPVRRRASKDVGGKKSSEEDSIQRIYELDDEMSCSSLPSNNDNEESDGNEISCAPVRRSVRNDVGWKKSSEEDSIQRINESDDEMSCSSLPSNNDNEEGDVNETPCAPVRRGARKDVGGEKSSEEDSIQRIYELIDEMSYSSLPSNNDSEESDRNEESCAPVRRSVRKDFGGNKSSEEDSFERIHEDDFCEEMCWKSKDEQHQRTIENRDVYIKELKRIIITLVSEDVHQERPMGSLPEKLELLLSYFKIVHGKEYMPIFLNDDVFGKKYKFYIFLKAIDEFCLLEPISDACIIAYILYLHTKMKKENMLNRFRFVNPNYTSHLSTKSERVGALLDRFSGASTNQLVLVPCNVGNHWILTVINPYNKVVFLLDPRSHCIRDEVWQDVVNTALYMFSTSKGETERRLPNWEVIKAPRQPDSKKCGFYVMRYMREIIEFPGDLGLISLQSMFTKKRYSNYEIDEVRTEWAECVLDEGSRSHWWIKKL